MSAFPTRIRRRRSAALALSLGLLVSAVLSSPAAAARPTVTHEINNHFHNEFHIDGSDACPYPGVTLVGEGNEHLIIVDNGTTLKVKYGETFWYTETPDDPAYEPATHQGTDALVFIVDRDGDEFFHESFHDFGPTFWNPDSKIRFAVTFKTVNGEVVVDHTISRDMPPEGC